MDWEVLALAAQAMQDRELLAVSQECHPETLRQTRWPNAKVKESAAHIVALGVLVLTMPLQFLAAVMGFLG